MVLLVILVCCVFFTKKSEIFKKQSLFKDSKTIKLNYQEVPYRAGTTVLFQNSTGTHDTFLKQVLVPRYF